LVLKSFSSNTGLPHLVFANGFFVASEFALVGVRHSRIEMLAGTGDPSARRLLGLLESLNTHISHTVGNNNGVPGSGMDW